MFAVTDWLSMMPHTVIVEACTSANSYGELTYGSCTSYRAAIQGPQKFLHHGTQQEQVSRQTVYLASTSAVSSLARITLPAGFDVLQPPLLDDARVSDESGFHHVRLYLG